MQFEIQEPRTIPFYGGDKKLGEAVKSAGARRNMSPVHFAFRKIKNIILARLSYFCPLNGWRVKMNRWRGVHIGKNVYLGMHCVIDNAYPEYVYIEDNVSLAGEVTVIAHMNPYPHFEGVIEPKVAPVIIRKGAWIGVKSAVLCGAEVGEYAIVSAGSVVDKKVDPCTIVIGNPARKKVNFSTLMKDKLTEE